LKTASSQHRNSLHVHIPLRPLFHEGAIAGVMFRALGKYADQRGWLVEVYREDELPDDNHPQMGYISMTLPGVSRGPHEHVDQSDYFAFIGPGNFKLYLWDTRPDSPTYQYRQAVVVGESNMQAVIIPPGVVHAYKNVGDQPGWVVNLPNRLYKGHGRREPVDEIRHEELADSPFVMD
jgi:dTDP-4-dehydrorhamnose 3,5-epimerase